jgi:prepilin-type N-terminal cleavage/methylation domain-containing protein/prepilin-type processing-associated H-X9-DG protein
MMLPRMSQHRRRGAHRAFTLVELLVVIGIISLLIAILVPSISRARHQSKTMQCASNMRQICQGMYTYAADNKNRFPLNTFFPDPGKLWFQPERVGGLLAPNGIEKGGVFSCPEDADARISYSMNAWMSSQLEKWVTDPIPVPGKSWGSLPTNASSVILIIESWSSIDSSNTKKEGFTSSAIVGWRGDSPGKRFGAAGGLVPYYSGTRFGMVNCEIDFQRHRPSGSPGKGIEPIGSVNIGYADGHVELKSNTALADPVSGRSTLDSLWSPLDFDQNQ